MTRTETETRKADLKVHKTTGLKEKTDLISNNDDFLQKCRATGSSPSNASYNRKKNTLSCDVSQKEKDPLGSDVKAVAGKLTEVSYYGKEIDTIDDSTSIYEHLVVNHHMKFVSSKHRHSRQFTSEYLPLLKSLMSEQPKCDPDGKKYKTSAMLLSARGELAKVIAFNDHEIVNFVRKRTCFGNSCDDNLTIITSK